MKMQTWLPLLLTVILLLCLFGYQQTRWIWSDVEAPEIEVDGSQMLAISVKEPREALLQGVSAKDRRDGDLTRAVVVETVSLVGDHGVVEVTYAVADTSGNVAKQTRLVKYVDYISPRFTLKKPLIYPENYVFDVLKDVGATDAVDGDIQHRVRAALLSENAISEVGTHRVVFQVTNDLGDTSRIEIPVEVQSGNRFDATLNLTEYITYLTVGAEFDPEQYLLSFVCRGEEVLLNGEIPSNYSLQLSGQVDTEKADTYVLDYTMTCKTRNATNSDYDQTYTGFSRLIVVVEG